MSLYTPTVRSSIETRIAQLGSCTVPSPILHQRFIGNDQCVLYDLDATCTFEQIEHGAAPTAFEAAGPRKHLFFEPSQVRAAIVTCGGLCPGINDVIRAIVHELYFLYGVRSIRGIRYGYAGLNPEVGWPMVDLTPETVVDIHEDGGSFLGSSRGPQSVSIMVDTLQREDINMLFVIGGDGSLRGALRIFEEISKRKLPIALVGIPKTIDNDIDLVSRTFGFETAVGVAVESIRCAHNEAKGYINGIGIVKLMGRNAGYVAACAALAQADVNFVLIPEVPFNLDGRHGLLRSLERRLKNRHHAVIVVAEGAGQYLFDRDLGSDASGNPKLGDIGLLLKSRIESHFSTINMEVSIKYIDPSYNIRAVPANSNDRIFCLFLGQNAVHAGMAGKTGMLVGSWNNLFVHIPIEAVIKNKKQVDPMGMLWVSVLESTGQSEQMFHTI